MSQYRILDLAESDLADIWNYVAVDSMNAADGVTDAIIETFPLLAGLPEMGRRREELAANMRSFPVGNYTIFYRPVADGIEVMRVLHGARDIPTLFG